MGQRFALTRTGSGGRSAAVSFGLFMIMLDNTVVNVALPAIQAPRLTISQLEWVVTGYALTFARADAHGRQARRPASGGG